MFVYTSYKSGEKAIIDDLVRYVGGGIARGDLAIVLQIWTTTGDAYVRWVQGGRTYNGIRLEELELVRRNGKDLLTWA